MTPLQDYREQTRALRARLRLHFEIVGRDPPEGVLRRYASLRYLQARWWLRARLDDFRADLLEDLAERMGLATLAPGTPLCLPDLPDSCATDDNAKCCAAWNGKVLLISIRDL